MYSETVRRLLAQLPGGGVLSDATHRGRAENPICGDTVVLHLVVESDRITRTSFQASGCPATIAAAAALMEILPSMEATQAGALDIGQLLDYLGGLPDSKKHGVAVALDALKEALSG